MMKIRALNRDSLSDEDAPVLRKELQEEIALEIYNNALRLQGSKDFEKSKELFMKLLNENIPQLESQGGLPKSMSTLKFACNLNLGRIFHEEKNNLQALDYYMIASELDQKDITLWYKIGKLSVQERRFKPAIYAFSKGLECYDSHWPCLEEIIPLLFAVRDTVNCLFYIGKTLELNPNYMKGLVLRKKIYQDNPATKEYYQALNPDYKWEPPLDVEIKPEVEEKYLKEVQSIIDIINEAERALESEPLRTIPLPQPLENYSWLSLSKCIKDLYEYISSNELSFLTFVDLDKCMSQKGNEPILNEDKDIEKIIGDVDEPMEVQDSVFVEEKIDASREISRRPSQTSEDNGTPVQTDNDDEQQTEHDNEEQEERNDKSKRNLKRKRDLLSDLRVWGWHSKRKNVRKTRPDKFYTVEDCLNQILPSNLLRNKIVDSYLQDESMNDIEENRGFLEDNHVNVVSSKDANSSSELYFGTQKEKDDVLKLWNNVKEDCDITVLVREYVRGLANLWNIKWPQELISYYVFIHEKYSEFYQLPNIYDQENKFEDIRIETLSNLLYAELALFSYPKIEENNRSLHIGQVQFAESAVAIWEIDWQAEYMSTFSRIIWLRAYIARTEKNYDTAVRYLELLHQKLEDEDKKGEKFSLFVPNSNKYNSISRDGVEKILKHLQMIKSVSLLEELFDQENYKQVTEIVISTFESDSGYPTVGKIGRPTQLGMLLHSFWYTDFDKCFYWCEECLFEAYPHYTKPGPNRPQWEAIVEKCLLMMHEIIKNKSRDIVDVLPNDKKARLTETLARIICKQIYTENSARIPLNTVAPWMILHHLLAKNEENVECDAESEEIAVPASLSILFSAHEFLGPKSWCLTGKGELLHYILDVLLDREDAYKYERLREKLDIQIEQALFCLYQHPSKKNKISRHLADHNVDPLQLTWEKSFQLYEFYAPEVLPEFNSFKNASITLDLEQLLLRITALVKPECNPSASVPKIKEYLQGKTKKIPDPIEFPYRIQAIYYLLGDYYFKLKDFVRCVDFFLMDLAINPKRVDSWACLGLSYLNQLELKLNFCKKMKSEEEFLDRAKYAQVAFTTALNLSPDNITLWIEFATFEYMAHSFCSRYLGHESENMSMEKFTHLENKKNDFLESSRQSFERAIALYDTDGNDPDERWLHYYILGKIAEKKQSEPKEYLGYYLTASQLLQENNATYPEKIAYNSPQHLSVEALELHYRMNASILKYLELHEGKDIDHSIGALFKKSLDTLPINKRISANKAAQKRMKKAAETADKQKKLEEEVKKVEEQKEEEVKRVDEPKKVEVKEMVENVEKMDTGEKEKEKVDGEKLETKEKSEEVEETTGNKRKREDEIESIVENLTSETTPNEEASTERSSKIQKLEEDKKDEREVKVVDEVILVDSEYDVILILSSDDEDAEISKQEEEKLEKSDENTPGSDPNKTSNNTEKTEKIVSDDIKESNKSSEKSETEIKDKEEEETPKEFDSQETVMNETNEKIAEQIASGMDVQLILDKMMQETMETTAQHSMEVDSDTTGLDRSLEILDSENLHENEDKEKEPKKDEKLNGPKESDGEENKKSTGESTTSDSSSSSSESTSSSDSDSDDESSSESSSSSSDESSNDHLSKNEILHLVDRCVKGLELCIIRLSKNYKAVYRLVHLYFHYKERKNLGKCKQLLLGEYKCYDNNSITGLFADRKNNNFFNGIWRIPSSEIDRPGSLSAHMIRCVTILLQILRASGDFETLLDMYFQLKKSPDPDKIYIKDTERLQFSEQAISLSIQILRENIQKASGTDNESIKKLLQDIYKSYVRIQKYAADKESVFGNMLVDLYKSFIKEKIPETVNVLDLATKFCQQMKIAEKQQNLMVSQNMTLQNPLTPMGPVLPSPSNVNPSSSSVKRPSGLGRPRGRPPLPKVPGQVKPPRKSSSWKKSSVEQPTSQDYLKQYKEELMKQYSQSFNFLQSAQFAQMYSNTLMSSYMQAQQSNMMGANLLQQFPALGAIDPLRMNFTQKQYEEMAEMLRKMTETAPPKKTKHSSSSSNDPSISKTDSPHRKIEQPAKKLKTDFNTPSKTESSKQKSQTQPDTTSKPEIKQKQPDTVPSISILPVPKEKPSSSCVSSISIIPKPDPPKEETTVKTVKNFMKVNPSTSISPVPLETVKKTELESPKPRSPLSVIMPPPGPLMLPPSNPNLNFASPKQTSPRRTQKELGQMSKLKNIEATISKVPQIDSLKKMGKEALSQMSNFGLDTGLLKFPPSLSLTPVAQKTCELQQPVLSSKATSGRMTESYVPKLPSSITLTPSLPLSMAKSTGLEIYPKSDTNKESKKYSSPKSAHQNKNVELHVADFAKLKNMESSSKSGLPFNVDSMLQHSPKQPHLQYGFPQVGHTSVITSTNMLDQKFMAPPKPMENRGVSKGGQGFSKKTAGVARPDLYKVDDQRPYDIQMSNLYASIRKDMAGPTSPTASVITATSKASAPSTFVPARTSPGKTLQEKLADKKREQASKQLFEQMNQQKPAVHQSNIMQNFGNPHSVSKILSRSSNPEASTSKMIPPNIHPIVSSNSSLHEYSGIAGKPTQRRKSSSDESVIFLD